MKYYVKCTGYKTAERCFTRGKIYEVENGNITSDDGFVYQRRYHDNVIDFLSDWYKFERVKSPKKIVITTDGVETLARLYDSGKVIKSAIAKCSPDDEFDFEFGANLAMERLIAKEEKKANPFKVGDIVRIGKTPHKKPATDFMAKYAGKCGEVREVYEMVTRNEVFVRMFVDDDNWYWNTDDVELIERNEQ